MPRLVILTALIPLLPLHAEAADVLTRRPDGTWQRTEVPGTRPTGRLDVRPVPGPDRAAVYDRRGQRVGTLEGKPYGGTTLYEEQGKRR